MGHAKVHVSMMKAPRPSPVLSGAIDSKKVILKGLPYEHRPYELRALLEIESGCEVISLYYPWDRSAVIAHFKGHPGKNLL